MLIIAPLSVSVVAACTHKTLKVKAVVGAATLYVKDNAFALIAEQYTTLFLAPIIELGAGDTTTISFTVIPDTVLSIVAAVQSAAAIVTVTFLWMS